MPILTKTPGMNIFYIPSWYPSEQNPHTGIFNKEQVAALAHCFPEDNFAISHWGSHNEDLLLWGRDHFKNLHKLYKFLEKKPTVNMLHHNLLEFYSPAFTWSRKFLKGNMRGLIKVNEKHFNQFREAFGPIDLIHAHSAHPAGWISMQLAHKHRLPYVITEHMTPFPFQSFVTKSGAISAWLTVPFQYSSRNIVVSPMQQEILHKHNIPSLSYIPNLTNEDFFRPAVNKKSIKNSFTFFTLGRMSEQKGIPFLLEAIRILKDSYPEVLYNIGGNGENMAEYKQLAHQLGIKDKISWLGTLNRAQALTQYQQCDAFVLPSLHENLPLVLLEAIACGKPIIGTRCGGPESVINTTNGLLAAPGDAGSLARAMEQMISSQNQYQSEEIRADFCRRYSRQLICNEIRAVYQEVIAAYRN